jgi:hypothetical protein
MGKSVDLDGTLEDLLRRPCVGWRWDEESYVRSRLPALIAELRACREVVEEFTDWDEDCETGCMCRGCDLLRSLAELDSL